MSVMAFRVVPQTGATRNSFRRRKVRWEEDGEARGVVGKGGGLDVMEAL